MLAIQILIMLLAVFTVGYWYVPRLDVLQWTQHKPRCILAHLGMSLGLLLAASAALMAGPLETIAAAVVLACAWLHLLATSSGWSGGHPPETETKPAPLDGLPQ